MLWHGRVITPNFAQAAVVQTWADLEGQRRDRLVLMAQLQGAGIIPAVPVRLDPDPLPLALVLEKTHQPGPAIDRVLKQQLVAILNQEGTDTVLVSPI